MYRVVFIVEALGSVFGPEQFLASSLKSMMAYKPQVCDAYDPLIHL